MGHISILKKDFKTEADSHNTVDSKVNRRVDKDANVHGDRSPGAGDGDKELNAIWKRHFGVDMFSLK